MAIVRKSLDDLKRTAIDTDELVTLKAMRDDEIDYDDIPPLTDAQIVNFKLYKPTKQQVTLRLDSDVLAWLKKDGKGYQTRANQLLRQLMLKELNA